MILKRRIIKKIPQGEVLNNRMYKTIEVLSTDKVRKVMLKGGIVNEIPLQELLVDKYCQDSYEEIVSQLIREKYSLDAELAILRQRDVKNEEFIAYNEYAEQCKAIAKEFVKERDDWLWCGINT